MNPFFGISWTLSLALSTSICARSFVYIECFHFGHLRVFESVLNQGVIANLQFQEVNALRLK